MYVGYCLLNYLALYSLSLEVFMGRLMAGMGRYVKLNIAPPMCRSKLCVVSYILFDKIAISLSYQRNLGL